VPTLAVIAYPPLVRIHLGPLAISPHGIMAALGFLAGAALLRRAARERGIDEATISALVTRALIGGIVGARFFYVLNHPSEFASPLHWLRVWEGGLALLGGIAGAVGAALPLIARRGLRLLQVLDAAAPGLALGIAIGRVGDLVIADHLGTPTSFALGFRCPPAAVVGETVGSPCPPGMVVHLTALYDLVGGLLVFGRSPGSDAVGAGTASSPWCSPSATAWSAWSRPSFVSTSPCCSGWTQASSPPPWRSPSPSPCSCSCAAARTPGARADQHGSPVPRADPPPGRHPSHERDKTHGGGQSG
jgi:hypothetical protein